MTPANRQPDEALARVHGAVRKWYGERVCSGPGAVAYPVGRAGAEALGYDPAVIKAAPREVVKSFCGVGNPFALGPPGAGEAVLDVGCGGGFDVFVASQGVGPTGRVLGIDLTPEVVEHAREGLRGAGIHWAQIEEGCAESIPCEDGCFDLVVSNGALNLSPDKARAFAEIHRVLRRGGRLQFADIVRSDPTSNASAGDPDAWSQ
jgi:arsenite methyltransferase